MTRWRRPEMVVLTRRRSSLPPGAERGALHLGGCRETGAGCPADFYEMVTRQTPSEMVSAVGVAVTPPSVRVRVPHDGT